MVKAKYSVTWSHTIISKGGTYNTVNAYNFEHVLIVEDQQTEVCKIRLKKHPVLVDHYSVINWTESSNTICKRYQRTHLHWC